YILKGYKRFIGVVWVLIVLILWYQVSSQAPLIEAILITLCMFSAIFTVNSISTNYLLPKAIRRKRMNLFWCEFIILAFVQAIMMSLILYAFRQLEQLGIFLPSKLFSIDDSFLSDLKNQIPACIIINLAFVGLRFYHEHIKLEKAHLESQLYALQAQINPHFMFNVLNHIHYFVKKKDDIASPLLLDYSDILRYQLYSGKKDFVSLEEDIQFLKKFIAIEKMRWEDKIEIKCFWKIENTQMRIPPLLLITLIENAFKHVSRLPNERGYINLYFEQDKNIISLEIENSKSTLPVVTKANTGLGLGNLKNRLDILFPNKYSLLIEDTDTIYKTKLVIQM
ncbi:histidine kinase, partial [Dysgonomonas sp. Marseille-P4677]|uniref:sensor histidine kinase n=1 Tax=Dysgonomonas sp. Marseille-P4677 TaxID=2364790 RepID=UPI0019147854